MEATRGFGGCSTVARSGPMMHKLMEILGLKTLQPQDVAVENLAADTTSLTKEVGRRRESLEQVGFPFAEALTVERASTHERIVTHYERRHIDD